jgi:hypothetical protein
MQLANEFKKLWSAYKIAFENYLLREENPEYYKLKDETEAQIEGCAKKLEAQKVQREVLEKTIPKIKLDKPHKIAMKEQPRCASVLSNIAFCLDGEFFTFEQVVGSPALLKLIKEGENIGTQKTVQRNTRGHQRRAFVQ